MIKSSQLLTDDHKAKALDILDSTLNGISSAQKVRNLAVGELK